MASRYMASRRHEVLVCTAAFLAVWFLGQTASGAQTAEPSSVCPPASSAPAMSVPPATPSGQPVAQQVIVACVGSQQITEKIFKHWSAIAARGESSPSGHHVSNAQEILEQVMSFLISADWVIGEAQDLGLHVPIAQVRRTFDQLRRAEFPKRGEFEAFLRSSGQTVADVLFRVELNLLSMRIQAGVIARQRSQRAKERALERFVSEFRAKWLPQTFCSPGHQVSDCGHVQAQL